MSRSRRAPSWPATLTSRPGCRPRRRATEERRVSLRVQQDCLAQSPAEAPRRTARSASPRRGAADSRAMRPAASSRVARGGDDLRHVEPATLCHERQSSASAATPNRRATSSTMARLVVAFTQGSPRAAPVRSRGAARTSSAHPRSHRPLGLARERVARGRSGARPRRSASRQFDPGERLTKEPLVVLVVEALRIRRSAI